MIIQERYLTICLQGNTRPLSSPNVWTDRDRFLLWQALSDKVKNWLCQSASTEKHTGANFKGCRKASPKTMRSFSLLTFARSRASSDFGIGKQRITLNLSILFKILYLLLFICYKLKLFSDYLLQFTLYVCCLQPLLLFTLFSVTSRSLSMASFFENTQPQ